MTSRLQRRFRPVLLGLALACGPAPTQGPAQASPQPRSTEGVVVAETVARGLAHPWGLAFLPDGRMLVTERPGRLRVVAANGALSAPLAGVPAVYARGQGGLLDVAVDPDFARTRLVWLTFAEPDESGELAGTALARGRLVGEGSAMRLDSVRVVYRQQPKLRGGGHYGSRIVFARDGRIFVAQGDRMNWRELAQDLTKGMGKIVRIAPDGSVPDDNPFARRQRGALPEIWSYGHRNVQAAALDPATGRLWAIEHGPRGGDELNQPEAGKNYGWPVITYGREYSGGSIGGTTKEGMEQPVYYWDPVIAPSGMTFYTGDAIPGWKGSILVGSMNPGALVRLDMRNGRVAKEERYLGELGARIRDVQQGPDGFVYVVTDASDGQVLRVRPAKR